MSQFNTNTHWFAYINPVYGMIPPPGPFRAYHISFVDSGYVFVQYWFFYGTSYSPALESLFGAQVYVHEGDWEMVQFAVRLKRSDDMTTTDIDESTKPYWLAPFAATASQHFYGQTLKWEEASGDHPPTSQNQDYLEKSGAFQPVVYVGRKSHATYFRAGSFTAVGGSPSNPQFQYGSPDIFGFDSVDGATTFPIANSDLRWLKEQSLVNQWAGRWGRTIKPLPIALFPSTDNAFPPDEPGLDLDPDSPTFLFGTNSPPSPAFRGPLNAGEGSFLLIENDPKGFHNAFLKATQGTLAIP